MTGATATPTCQTIELHLTNYPDQPYRWGGGSVRPTRAVITTLNDHRTAHLYGTWVSQEGEINGHADQLYRHDDTWPDWLTALADEYRPAVLIARPGASDDRSDDTDPRGDGIDSLRTQLATAQKQAEAWNDRIRDLTAMIRQHEQNQAEKRTAGQATVTRDGEGDA
ncbi:hypothetical protein [Streptomyces sp. NPDC004783]|uniref:hypothetical protein n=1 Tax=Streptomyces sp. NPDC004783 TaxID=3154459 RepID=UPI0033AAD5D4